MRKRDDTLQETLLSHAREIASSEGIPAISIRKLAALAGVSVGTVYNYFPSKDDILLALTEEYWRNTLKELQKRNHSDSFVEQLREIYAFLRGRADSAGMLMGSLSNAEQAGREKMQAMQQVLRSAILQRMDGDTQIHQGIWSAQFTQEAFADFILRNLTQHLSMRSANIDFFLELLKRTLYP